MYKYFKRFFDIVFSFLSLPLFLISFLLFAPIIYFTDKGPIFYRGERIGQNGKVFKMTKFRTMYVDSPDLRLEDGSTFNSENDPRVTKIGKFLRKTSIDELPQILDVFVGKMSFVGPRPDTPDWLDIYPDDIKEFLKVKPGITGYSQAYFRNSVDGIEKMKNDLYYAQNISFLFDVKIFFKTIVSVLKRENTYKVNEGKIVDYGYEYDSQAEPATIEKEGFTESLFKNFYCVRSGRDALKYIASKHNDSTILIPSLACDSIVLSFAVFGCKVCFYKLNEDFSANLQYLKDQLKEIVGKKVLLYMDYFSNPSLVSKDLIELKRQNPDTIFVEDITQTFLEKRKSSFIPDYVVASVRKWINIPDGGLLWIKNKDEKPIFIDSINFATKRAEAQHLKHIFLEKGDESIKQEYRSIFSNVYDLLNNKEEPVKMSTYSFNVLKKTNFKRIKKIRKRNAAILINILSRCDGIRFIQENNSKNLLYVPILINNRDLVQKELSRLGVFATIIWPISKEQKAICEYSKYVEEHMLALPCDQRYAKKDMHYIGDNICKIISKFSNTDNKGD